jgi:hypothetical protein
MDNIIKFALVVVGLYLVYNYWRKNISPKGIEEKKDEELDSIRIQALATKLQDQALHEKFIQCNATYKAGSCEWFPCVEHCKNLAKGEIGAINWLDRARLELGI